jgi:hypothetical protein
VFYASQQTCDTVPSPSAKLNITASEIGTAWYVWRQRLREHNLLNHSLSREDLYYGADDDDAADDNFVLVPI